MFKDEVLTPFQLIQLWTAVQHFNLAIDHHKKEVTKNYTHEQLMSMTTEDKFELLEKSGSWEVLKQTADSLHTNFIEWADDLDNDTVKDTEEDT